MISPAATQSKHASLSPLRALWALLAIVVILAGYLIACHVLGIVPTYAGILLLYYWVAVKHAEPRELAPAFVGALAGVGNAWLLVVPSLDPGTSALIGLGLLVVALYCLLAGFLPWVFNQAYMLLVTVAAIPLLLVEGRFAGMASSIALSAVYFGGLVWAARWAVRRRKLHSSQS